MKHIIFTLFLTTCFCMKKGGSFTRMMSINSQSIKDFDQPVYSQNQGQRAQVLQQKSQAHPQDFDNQQVQQALLQDANNQQRQNERPQFVNVIASQQIPTVVISQQQMEESIESPCEQNDQLIMELSQLPVMKQEGEAQVKRISLNNKLRTVKIYKYNFTDQQDNKDIGKEIYRLYEIEEFSDSHFIQYKKCFFGNLKKDYFIVLVLQNYAHSLNYVKNQNYTNGYLFMQNVPIIQRAKMYRDLLYSLEQLHQNDLVHRNIKPSNIVSNLSIENYSLDKKTQYQLLITDMSIMQNSEVHGKINGTLNYLHPHLFIGEKRIIGDYLDIYAFALTFIEISTYKKNQFDKTSFFGDYLKNLNDYKKKPKEELIQYYSEQFTILKNRIQKMIGITDQQTEEIKSALAECTERSNPEQHFNGLMRSICQKNIECILFSALNLNINYIPDVTFYKETLNSVIANLNNRILI